MLRLKPPWTKQSSFPITDGHTRDKAEILEQNGRDLLSSALEPILPFLSTSFDKVTRCKFLVLAGKPVMVSICACDTHTLPPPPKGFRGFSRSHKGLSHSLMVTTPGRQTFCPCSACGREGDEEGAADLPKTTAEPPWVPARPPSLHPDSHPCRQRSWNSGERSEK